MASFVVYSSLCAHVSRCHRNQSSVAVTCTQNVTESCKTVKCSLSYCQAVIRSVKELLIHTRKHIREDKLAKCPFNACNRQFTNQKTFAAHVSRKHRLCSLNNVECSPLHLPQKAYPQPGSEAVIQMPAELQGSDNEHETHDLSSQGEASVSYNELMTTFALFCLKLQSKHLVPAATVQAIVNELSAINSSSMQYSLGILEKHLDNLGVSSDRKQEIFQDLTKNNPMSDLSQGPLRSIASRTVYFKNSMQYVPPVEICFGYNSDGVKLIMHYVPIIESLRLLFMNNRQHVLLGRHTSECGIFTDICDGSVLQNNCLTGQVEECFKIILYQDSFEIVNPLGSSKRMHKLLAVYYTLANIKPENRSQIDHMQLVLLCKERTVTAVGMQRVFGKLVEDVKKMEEIGIEIEEGKYVRGTITCVVGDNLGSHSLGGFTENFSSSEFFCRFCTMSRTEFCSKPYVIGHTRTQQNYAQSVQMLQENPDLRQHNGITKNSPLNDLHFFHVCQPGLPPCLGHDLFEGIVSYDVAIYLKYFIRVKHWFSYSILARRIKRFAFIGCDNLDRPPVLAENAERLSGHAVQNWTLLRFLPLIIGTLIKDTSDAVWEQCLKLRHITEIVCAPSIDVARIYILNGLIEDYIEQRHDLFPERALRPKHHYLCHYPQLIMNFGPLMRVWTMRFESKHSFFKRCFRRLQNCKNVTKMLSEKHQLLQAYYASGSLFKEEIIPDFSHRLCLEELSTRLQCAVVASALTSRTSEVIIHKVTVRGTEYGRDMYVCVRRVNEVLYAGRIEYCILTAATEVLFVVEMYSTNVDHGLNVHRLCQLDVAECVKLTSILNFCPLHAYYIDGPVLVLKHAV